MMSSSLAPKTSSKSSVKSVNSKVLDSNDTQEDQQQLQENMSMMLMNNDQQPHQQQQDTTMSGGDTSMMMNTTQLHQGADDDDDDDDQPLVAASATKAPTTSTTTASSKQKQQLSKQAQGSNATTYLDHQDDASSMSASSVHQEMIGVDRLLEQGVAQVDISKLKSAGIFTVPGIHMQCRKDLNNIKGLSEAKVEKIVEAAKKLCDAGFATATRCLERRQQIPKLTTGCRDLDTLLGGGIEACAITEAFGEFRTGKSQIAHTLCVTCQLPTSHGGNQGKAVFVDTEGTFRPERITPIALRFGLDPEKVLDNILVARAFTHEHQANLIAAVAAKMANDKYALLVVDSITALFRTDFSGRGELAERQQKLGKMMNQLMKVAEEFQVAVYITNQVVADPGAAAMFVADPKKPVGGHIIAHASTTRLSLRKGRGENRICKIYDSPSLPESECQFSISESGINDATSA